MNKQNHDDSLKELFTDIPGEHYFEVLLSNSL